MVQRLSVFLHGTLGFYLGDALQEDVATVVACLPVPRAWASLHPLPSPLLVDSIAFFVILSICFTTLSGRC
jgi:hypothetical protein